METLAKKFLVFAFISTLPMQLITALWLVTIGYFSWLEAIHSEPYAVFTSFFVLFAFIVAIVTPKEDIHF
tara:strand:+ start:266 stop:475 length:210 start_codon:yes stop_codon:yes gene_type:complete